jgi:hypothetical protein
MILRETAALKHVNIILITGGRGGNGGGAVKIIAERSIKITGVISVAGENGQGDIPVGSGYAHDVLLLLSFKMHKPYQKGNTAFV